ncbi:helix-turn-helix domain-containing protein [Edaphobacter sp. 12200R-103]|uniref:helix-turn-helix domain-containing protein n=1 Tax=Edaphobacter sp. 12200R-103 TaxID=2703788 RepID=UPI00138D62A1|nr:helix-turn-helix domain-containing protein [Edaphobacter sp. 12200R-103]QHS50517.1 helix-turn-helix domain-containing protein [Edaphobacter sp. 12200R-103]
MLQHLKLPSQLDGNVWRYANPAGANRLHRHAELELNVVTQGKGTYLLGGRRYEIRRGDLLWLFPAQEHVLVEQTSKFEMWIAVFRRRAIRRQATDAGAKALLQPSFSGEVCRRLSHQDLDRFEAFFEDLSSSQGEYGLMNAGLGYILLHAWKCFQHAADVPVRELHPAVERAVRMLAHDVSEDGLAELAHRAGLSTSRLSRLFKQQTGLTLVDFRNRKRIERFQQIYDLNRNRTLLDAALEAGFGSYPQFHRVCRQILGCSPAEYARRTLP